MRQKLGANLLLPLLLCDSFSRSIGKSQVLETAPGRSSDRQEARLWAPGERDEGKPEGREDALGLAELANVQHDPELARAAGRLVARRLRSLAGERQSYAEFEGNSTGGLAASRPRKLRVQVAALHVDKSEFPLSKLLFKLTLRLALREAQKYLDEQLDGRRAQFAGGSRAAATSASGNFSSGLLAAGLDRVELAVSVRSANTCSRQYAAALAAEQFHLKRARLFIVSGCDGAIRAVSRLASRWRVPIMTAAGFGADLSDKRVHRTLVRVAFSLRAAVEFLFKILKSFQWRRVNLLVDESDANSLALRNSIERHLDDFRRAANFSLQLNIQTLDLQWLQTQPAGGGGGGQNEAEASAQNNSDARPAAGPSDDQWPNQLTGDAIGDALRQCAGYSRVSVVLMAQQHLRKFMLSVYDQNMANGLYTFLSMPLLPQQNGLDDDDQTESSSSPAEDADQLAGKRVGPAAGKSTGVAHAHAAPLQQANSGAGGSKPHQSYSTSTGANVFVWRSQQARARNAQAKQAFESLMSIYLRTPTTKAYVYFANELGQLANADYATTTTVAPLLGRNASLEPAPGGRKKLQLNITPYSASFYDCLQIYARALHQSLQQQVQQQRPQLSARSNDSRAAHSSPHLDQPAAHQLFGRISDLVRDRRFDNLVTGSVYINPNGDRDTDYTLDDMNQMTGKFAPVILYRGETRDIERLGRIHWSSDASVGPTSDTADCALTSSCASKPWAKFTLLLMFLAVPLALILGGLFYIVHSKLSSESQLVDFWWRIHLADLEFVETRRRNLKDGSLVASGGAGSIVGSTHGGTSTTLHRRQNKTPEAGSLVTLDNTNQRSCTEVTRATGASGQWATSAADVCYGNIELAVFKLTKVALKPIGVKLHQSRKLMIELRSIKELNHANLCRFVGILVDEGRQALVSEFCPKGSLREFFQNESMVIDWTFKFSIINDILAGLLYLSSSALGFHGRLKSSNCLVSGRFVVRLSDFGPASLLDQMDHELNERQTDEWLRKAIWLAPEHMKLSGSRGCGGSMRGDVYSFGLILYEVITNCMPFFSVAQSRADNTACAHPGGLRALAAELRLHGPQPDQEPGQPDMGVVEQAVQQQDASNCAPGLRLLVELMRACWSFEPGKRPSLADVSSALKKITKGTSSKKLLENLTERMEQYTNNLESLVDAKLACLMEEKLKTEELLYQFVPKSIASLLREGQFVEPEAFECVTVFYSDIVGFTSLSSESSPMEVVDFLSELYLCFDETLEQHDIFKVDTIGDAYIVASGLPQPNEGKHVVEIALAALELRARLKQFKIPHKPGRSLEMRVGIHSGPCVAGIVGGLNMPKYCVFGDTLTTGKFMESSGLPMKIHITEESRQLLAGLDDRFHMEPRVPRITRDGLPYQTYWLEPACPGRPQDPA